MEQFVKQINNANEEKINLMITEQRKRGYKAISISCGINNWATYTVVILFEKIETKY